MTDSWFSRFYGMTDTPDAGNHIEKAAFAELGRTIFIRNKIAERIENGNRLYHELCNDKEASEQYSSLLKGVARAKEANIRATAIYNKDANPKDIVNANRKSVTGIMTGAGAGTGAGLMGMVAAARKVRNPFLKGLAMGGSLAAGMIGGTVAGAKLTEVPKHLRHKTISYANTNEAITPQPTWNRNKDHLEASRVMGGSYNPTRKATKEAGIMSSISNTLKAVKKHTSIRKHPYIATTVAGTGGVAAGIPLGKDIGAYRLTDNMYPGLNNEVADADSETYSADISKDRETDAGKARLAAARARLDNAYAAWEEKYDHIRETM